MRPFTALPLARAEKDTAPCTRPKTTRTLAPNLPRPTMRPGSPFRATGRLNSTSSAGNSLARAGYDGTTRADAKDGRRGGNSGNDMTARLRMNRGMSVSLNWIARPDLVYDSAAQAIAASRPNKLGYYSVKIPKAEAKSPADFSQDFRNFSFVDFPLPNSKRSGSPSRDQASEGGASNLDPAGLCVCTCVCVCMYVCVCICIYIYVCVCV